MNEFRNLNELFEHIKNLGVRNNLPNATVLRIQVSNQMNLMLLLLGLIVLPSHLKPNGQFFISIAGVMLVILSYYFNSKNYDIAGRFVTSIIPATIMGFDGALFYPTGVNGESVYKVAVLGSSTLPLILFGLNELTYKISSFTFVVSVYFGYSWIGNHFAIISPIDIATLKEQRIRADLIGLAFVFIEVLFLEVTLTQSIYFTEDLLKQKDKLNDILSNREKKLNENIKELELAQNQLKVSNEELQQKNIQMQKLMNEIELNHKMNEKFENQNKLLAYFADQMHTKSEENLSKWSKRIINELVQQFNGLHGGIFLKDAANENIFQPIALIAPTSNPNNNFHIQYGVGLHGQCLERKQTLLIEAEKFGLTSLQTAFASIPVKKVILIPLVLDHEAHGLIEISFGYEIDNLLVETLEKICNNITGKLIVLYNNEHIKELLIREKEINTQLTQTRYEQEKNIEALIKAQTETSRIQKELDGQILALNNAAIVVKTDFKGSILYANETFCIITGTNAQELVGKNHQELPINWSYELLYKNMRRALVLGQTWKGILEINLPNSEKKWIETTMTPIIGINGKPNAIVSVGFDITEIQNTQNELIAARKIAEESNKMKERFLANMSHEMRTPLNGILGLATLLELSKLNIEQKEYLQLLKLSADNLLILINDILDISKIEAGKIELIKIEFSISDSIKQIENNFNLRLIDNKNQLIIKKHQSIPDKLIGDPYRLNQILMNLINNANKFTNHGTIELNIHKIIETEEEIGLQFEVTDTGIGIPEEWLDKIFDSFVQVSDNQNNYLHEGTGLGLAIVKQLIENQNGTIEVESEVNKGSKFRFQLSFGKSNQYSLYQNQKPETHIDNFSDLKILIAEDHPINQVVIQKMLELMNVQYKIAENGEEILEILENESFDLILMDIRMPILDGFQTTKIIRTEFPLPKCEIPIFAMTAHTFPEEEKQCYQVGMNDYLSKPFKMKDLVAKIKLIDFYQKNKITSINNEPKRVLENSELNYKIDLINEILNNDAELVRNFVGKSISEISKMIYEMKSHLKNKNHKEFSMQSHKLKSTFRYYDLETIALNFQKLETFSEDEFKTELCSELFEKCVLDCEIFIETLKNDFNIS